MDNDELIAAMAAGDDVALRELFARHAPWLAARLRAVLPAADVEDVLQESFLAAWRGAGAYRLEGGGAWLWGIARRQAALWLRRRGPAELLLPALIAADGRYPDDPAEAALSRAELADAVSALGPEGTPQRETWRLMYVEDKSVAEVARLMAGPMAYLVVAEIALTSAWTTPWTWAARPPHDLGAGICAARAFAAGAAVITIRGARDSARE